MSQLKMLFNTADRPMPQLPTPPEGFNIRPLNHSQQDTDGYLALRPEGGFSVWTPENLVKLHLKALPEGIFVVTENKTGRIVASASAETTDNPDFADIGVLGWVLTSAEFRGHGFGKAASIAAMHRLADAGYRYMSLLTDDWREAALHIYLSLGWHPWLTEDDMPQRWQNIYAKLHINPLQIVEYAKDRKPVIK